MTGEPKFKQNDRVSFVITDEKGELHRVEGDVYVVDPEGTSEQHEEPSYDIEAFHEGEVVLFKHIRESLVSERE